jgi:hypothetical protein
MDEKLKAEVEDEFDAWLDEYIEKWGAAVEAHLEEIDGKEGKEQ